MGLFTYMGLPPDARTRANLRVRRYFRVGVNKVRCLLVGFMRVIHASSLTYHLNSNTRLISSSVSLKSHGQRCQPAQSQVFAPLYGTIRKLNVRHTLEQGGEGCLAL